MSNDAEKQWVKLKSVVRIILVTGSLCFAAGVWKNSSDNQWKTQLQLNAQLGDRLTAVESKATANTAGNQELRESVRDLKSWLIDYVNTRTAGHPLDTGLLNHDTRAPN